MRSVVSGGRSGNAATDFAAGKTLQTPDMRGRAPFGLDSMGSSAANLLQTSTTITTTYATAAATVGSAAGLMVGMYVVSEKIPAGTTIAAITGTTVTLSTGVGVTAGSALAARFSIFPDAQQPGAVAGGAAAQLTAAQLPANIPNSATSSSTSTTSTSPGTAVGLTDGISTVTGAGGTSAARINSSTQSLSTTTATVTTVTINPDGGQAHMTLSPAMLVTWLIKL